ncbi:Oligo-1,6-glucosidase 1 [Thalassocella blandensis]|nr:Oligo-1,6-glucosidase 1 [Thalassocella blandensis]
MSKDPWWRGAVIYQIYPRSFSDSNGDGIGDLPGIIQKLDYIASLGVDAIWISPFFLSPMKDFGYDIADFRAVDPIFGNLQDFDELVSQAHQRNIKVIIDQVLSHTSDEHAWFQESRSSRENAKADWYVWADPKEDGNPPNNWLSIFGGGAWEWEPRRGQYYFHNFLKSQPDLNYHCPQVREAMLQEVEFWLKRGVDGFRLDAINFCFHDTALRDNPAKPISERRGRGFREDNPYAFQYHHFNNTRPENLVFLEDLRALMDRYPNTMTLGEVSSEDSLKTMAEYTEGDKRLNMAYSFELLVDTFSTEHIHSTLAILEQKIQDGWPCWSIGNHDVQRVLSRWGKDLIDHQVVNNAVLKTKAYNKLAVTLNAMLLSLRGSVSCYQGEELGLCEAPIEQHELQDPYGIAFWPLFKGRDGCRTPLPWDAQSEFCGFSNSTPWLPVADAHRTKAVAEQEIEKTSVLNCFRQFIAWRKSQPTLRLGSTSTITAEDATLSLIRHYENQHMLAVFHFSPAPHKICLEQVMPGYKIAHVFEDHGAPCATLEGDEISFESCGVFFAQVQKIQ